MVMIARSRQEVRKMFPDAVGIFESESKFFVEFKDKTVTIVLKPRNRDTIRQILLESFPKRAVEIVLNGVKMTEAIAKIKDKNWAIIEGPAGVGKTVAAVWRIAKMLRLYEINNPLYVSPVLYNKEVFGKFKEYDAFLLDDINDTELHEAPLKLLQSIIYYAEAYDLPVFITTNNPSVFRQFPEPILSRLSLCTYIKINGDDLRVKSLLDKKEQLNHHKEV